MPKTDAVAGDLRSSGLVRGAAFEIEFDSRPIPAHDGETVLGALWAAGIASLHVTARTGEPRGFYCGMGACFDCVVEIDGVRNMRACLTAARPGMVVRSQKDPGTYPAMAHNA